MYYLWGKETSNCKFDDKTGLAKAGEDPDIYQRWVEEKKGGKGWGENWEKINIESRYKRIKPLYCFFRLMDGVKSWGSDWVAKDPVFFFCLRLHHERMLCHKFDDSYWCLKISAACNLCMSIYKITIFVGYLFNFYRQLLKLYIIMQK